MKDYDSLAKMNGGQSDDYDKLAQQFGAQVIEAERRADQAMMTHPAPLKSPKDAYKQTANNQSFMQNVLSGTGGALTGIGYVGPRSLFGLDKPGEVKEWKDSMAGLSDTVGGTIGQVLGYAAPAAVVAPFVGASVPVAAGVGAAEGMLLPAEGMKERALNVVTSAGGATLGQAGGNALAGRLTKRAANKSAEVAKKKSQNSVRDATLAASQAEGYVVPPSYAGTGLFPRFMEGLSGKYKTNQLAGIKNQEVTNKLARKALGLADDAPLTDDALDAYRRTVSQPYRDVANLPKRPSSPFSGMGVKSAPFNPAKTLEDLKEARYNAKMYWRGANMGNPEALALARQTDAAADALENQIETYAKEVGDSDLINRLVESRMKIAQSYTVEKALNEGTGNVDATKLARMLEKGDPLTGDLEKAGKFGMAFHDVARAPKSGDANPLTALDFMTGTLSSGVGGAAWGGPGAMTLAMLPPAARVASRYSLLSEPIQRAFIKPNYNIGIGNRFLPRLLDNPVMSPMYPAMGIYGYGVQPQIEQ